MNISDDDLEELEETHPQTQLAAARAQQQAQQPPMRFYDLSLADAAAPTNGNGGLLKKKLGPLPVWGWGLLVAAVGTGGYVWYRVAKSSAKVKANKDDDDGGSESSSDESDDDQDDRSNGSWSPSRSQFGDKLSRYLTGKGLASKCKVYTDADEADKDKDLKTVSPLITIKVTGTKIKVDKGLDRLCKREGLSPTVHEDGSIGLYPATTGKRGREWEAYVDALRDDGQQR